MSSADEPTSIRSSLRVDTYRAPTDRLITTPFVVVTAAALAFFMYIGTLLPLVPLYIEGPLDAGEFGVGLNAAFFAVAAIVARPVLGRLADRFGRRRVMVVGGLIAAVGAVGMSQATTLPVLLGFRALTGVGEASMFVGAATLIADLSPRSRRAEGASYFSVAVFGGLGIGPVLGEWILSDVHFERTFVVAAGFALLATAIASLVPAFVDSPDRSDDASADAALTALTGWRRHVHPAAVLPGIVLALGVGGLTSFFLFVPDYSREVGLGSSGGLFLAYSAITLSVRVVGAKIPERLGPRRAVTIALALMTIGLVVVGVVPSVAALWVGTLLIGLGIAFNYPSLMALVVNRVSDRERARAISSFTMFFEVGTAVSGVAVGIVAQLLDERVGFVAGAVMTLIGVAVLRMKVVPAGAPDAAGTLDRDPPPAGRPDGRRPVPVAGN